MIEGIGARYQIRAADVAKLVPFEFLNYVGAEISYRLERRVNFELRLRACRSCSK